FITAKVSMGFNQFNSDETSLWPQLSIPPISAVNASSDFAEGLTRSWIIELQLTYQTRIGSGVLQALLGATWQDRSRRGRTIHATDFANDLLLKNPDAAGMVTASVTESRYRYQAIFGRLNYNLRNKYLI